MEFPRPSRPLRLCTHCPRLGQLPHGQAAQGAAEASAGQQRAGLFSQVPCGHALAQPSVRGQQPQSWVLPQASVPCRGHWSQAHWQATWGGVLGLSAYPAIRAVPAARPATTTKARIMILEWLMGFLHNSDDLRDTVSATASPPDSPVTYEIPVPQVRIKMRIKKASFLAGRRADTEDCSDACPPRCVDFSVCVCHGT